MFFDSIRLQVDIASEAAVQEAVAAVVQVLFWSHSIVTSVHTPPIGVHDPHLTITDHRHTAAWTFWSIMLPCLCLAPSKQQQRPTGTELLASMYISMAHCLEFGYQFNNNSTINYYYYFV